MKKKKIALYVILASCLVLLQVSLWSSNNGILAILHLKKNITKQQVMNKSLMAKNEEIYKEVKRLRHGRQTVSGLARKELGLIKKGEVFYQFKNDRPVSNPSK